MIVIYGESWPQQVKDEEKLAYIFMAQRTKCLLLRQRLQSAYCHVPSYSPFVAQRQLQCVHCSTCQNDHGSQYYLSARDIIWKWKFDMWTQIIFLMKFSHGLCLALTHDRQIWSVTIVWELSLTFFQHVLKAGVKVKKTVKPSLDFFSIQPVNPSPWLQASLRSHSTHNTTDSVVRVLMSGGE